MRRDFKRVRERVVVPPTLAARPAAAEGPGRPELRRSAGRDAAPGGTQASAPDKPATAPRPAGGKLKATARPAPPFEPPPAEVSGARRWIMPIAACLVTAAGGWWLGAGNHFGMASPPALPANGELVQVKEALEAERQKAGKLAGELAGVWRVLKSQTAVLADQAALDQELTDLRQRLHQAEGQLETYQELLAQEQSSRQAAEEQPAAATDEQPVAIAAEPPAPEREGDGTPHAPDPALLPATARLTEKLAVVTDEKPAAPGHLDLARLMARASLLLGQGDIGAARIVLERAAEEGSTSALFALAETYDPAILLAWGTLGTRGDVAKAQDLYARAFAGGVLEAKDRMNALR